MCKFQVPLEICTQSILLEHGNLLVREAVETIDDRINLRLQCRGVGLLASGIRLQNIVHKPHYLRLLRRSGWDGERLDILLEPSPTCFIQLRAYPIKVL